jgi:hypothetical protein
MVRSVAEARAAFGMSSEWCKKLEAASKSKKVRERIDEHACGTCDDERRHSASWLCSKCCTCTGASPEAIPPRCYNR